MESILRSTVLTGRTILISLKPAGLVMLVACSLAVAPVHAKDFATAGQVFPIKEKHPVKFIIAKLEALKASGELAKIEKDWQKKVIASINRPPVTSTPIKEADRTRVRYFDPTIVVNRDINDHLGRVIVAKGTKVNPFDHISYDKKLLFIDADNSAHVEYALKQPQGNLKIILVKGAVIDLIKRSNVRCYFDYNGYIAKKFQLEIFPSLVEQDGKRLKITEVAL